MPPLEFVPGGLDRAAFKRHSTSDRVMSIGAGLKAGQLAARPNPGSEAKRCTYGKRKKDLCVVFHTVLQYTLRPRDRDRLCIRLRVYKRENSNACLN
jgi:hypothetical protein